MDLLNLPLASTCVCVVTRDGMPTNARNCLDDIAVLGASVRIVSGCADVALARNLVLTRAVQTAHKETDTFLLLDDDILYDRATIQNLVERSRVNDAPTSAVYVTNDGHVAASKFHKERWLVGLGCLAVPASDLRSYADVLPLLKTQSGQEIYPFCQSRWIERHSILGTRWLSEDYWFCLELGGVVLAPLSVQHYKRVPLYPDAETIAMLFGAPQGPAGTSNPRGKP